MLAVIYIVAVTMWWAQCIWKLVRTPPGYPQGRLAAVPPGDAQHLATMWVGGSTVEQAS